MAKQCAQDSGQNRTKNRNNLIQTILINFASTIKHKTTIDDCYPWRHVSPLNFPRGAPPLFFSSLPFFCFWPAHTRQQEEVLWREWQQGETWEVTVARPPHCSKAWYCSIFRVSSLLGLGAVGQEPMAQFWRNFRKTPLTIFLFSL